MHLTPQSKQNFFRFPGLLLHSQGKGHLGTSAAPNHCDQAHRTVELEERNERRHNISPVASLHKRIKGHDEEEPCLFRHHTQHLLEKL